MEDYKPIDLSRWCNEGASVLEDGEDVGTGRQAFLGLPFLIGGDSGDVGGKCFIALGGSDSSVAIPINQRARRFIVAHRMLEHDLSSGGSPGAQVAEYVFGLPAAAGSACPYESSSRSPTAPPIETLVEV